MEQSDIDDLIAKADRRAVYANQIQHAKERFHSLNILAWEGHIFELRPEFLSYLFLKYMEIITPEIKFDSDGAPLGPSPHDPIILLDKNEEPVAIKDMHKFVEAVEECHTEALNDYHDTYSRLQLARSTEELIEVA